MKKFEQIQQNDSERISFITICAMRDPLFPYHTLLISDLVSFLTIICLMLFIINLSLDPGLGTE